MSGNRERYEEKIRGDQRGDERPRFQHSGPGSTRPPSRPGSGGRQSSYIYYTGDRPHEELPLVPGQVCYGDGNVEINAGKDVITVRVRNTSDRPIQVGSHYHFYEVNPGLDFDREAAWGRRLNVISGGSMRFEPGDVEEAELIPIGGERIVAGLRGEVGGKLDDRH